MVPARNCRQLDWPVPITPRGGSAEVVQKFYFLTQLSGFISKPAFLNVPMGSVCRRGQDFVIDVIDQGLCQRKKPR
ncbi:hypothetical protein SAMN02746065_104207 [Desulfocicer vacuolatum DSM 3385]|uniref:Uncharacterized protein n=1 Tax=Desulfocicer vacuolatum DSM 3385 TaxID=1121400 RepID=A0A1W2A7Q6_9BACT|nr:hypothetical protein SAMN02746065_104207 [Desulfocicer vacuolatum DSM 3385]